MRNWNNTEKAGIRIFIALCFSFVLGSVLTAAFHRGLEVRAASETQEIVALNEAPENGIIFENENVAIKYFYVENGDYDILIETKNGTNISSEWDMTGIENHAFAYLVGRSEENAYNFYLKNYDTYFKELGYSFNWEENYSIER